MFDGRDYKIEFEEACEALTKTNDKGEVRQILIGIEWVLDEAINGVFVVFAFALTAIAIGLLGWLFDFQEIGLIPGLIVGFVGILFGLFLYWMARFIFWYEVSRHLKPRRFGDLFQNVSIEKGAN